MRLQLEISALLVATALAVAVPSIVAPSAALADRAAAYSTSALKQTNDEPQTCELEHEGRDWRWHSGRDGGHWDHWESDRLDHGGEWKHHVDDNHKCKDSNGKDAHP